MRAWMASTGVEVVGAGEIICLTPPELRGRSLLTVGDWELDGELPTVPIVFRFAKITTTLRPDLQQSTTAYDRSLLYWLPRRPADLDEYADSMDINFPSVIYDDDQHDDDDMPDTSYDVGDDRNRVDMHDGSASRTEVVQKSSSTSPPTELDVPVVHEQLPPASTTATTAQSTATTRSYVALNTDAERSTSSDSGGGVQNYTILLATLTILATVVVVVVVIVAIVMMTRRKEIGRKHRPTSIELQFKPTLNGVKNNGGAPNSRNVPRRSRKAENGLIGHQDTEVPRPPLPLVAFSDQVGSALDETSTAGATGLSCSVEALSLIPGRDINHEGPHRVYQWTDF